MRNYNEYTQLTQFIDFVLHTSARSPWQGSAAWISRTGGEGRWGGNPPHELTRCEQGTTEEKPKWYVIKPVVLYLAD